MATLTMRYAGNTYGDAGQMSQILESCGIRPSNFRAENGQLVFEYRKFANIPEVKLISRKLEKKGFVDGAVSDITRRLD